MAREGESSVKAETAPAPDDPRKPANPTDLRKPSIIHTIKRALSEFSRDQVTDLAAALTYYAVLSIFPALLALTSLLGLLLDPDETVDALNELLLQAGQGDVAAELEGPIRSLTGSPAAGFTLV
ncbi:MAG: YihY/virulence factor BrkB family protein, partial [Tetrasphaera sp.]|nr:YihY/virulence factor BrkB family protein [Tetrasphaera sp.]